MMTSQESQPSASISARDMGRNGAGVSLAAQNLRWLKMSLGCWGAACMGGLFWRGGIIVCAGRKLLLLYWNPSQKYPEAKETFVPRYRGTTKLTWCALSALRYLRANGILRWAVAVIGARFAPSFPKQEAI